MAQHLEARAALHAEAMAAGLSNAKIARRAARDPSLVSHFWRGAPSDRLERLVRRMIDERKAKGAA